MNKNRLETFSDGVLAIIITIMVLEFKVPTEKTFEAVVPLFHKFLGYILSFIYIGIYWSNHHHLLHTVKRVNGTILWANLHLLFWLSLIPFTTAWIGEHHFAAFPMMLYGIILMMNGIAYFILQQIILKHHGKESALAIAIGKDFKGKISVILYLIAVVLTKYYTVISGCIYIFVALMWLVPDKRIEKLFDNEND
ncbi:TMEM175 family protein [Flavobacterium sp. SUN052]|uniref:TMEM175 family protein n=1 Tax=Flavobacterium sp. SUN052 TaxID=3002441 RepID=UPI00237EA851|nr:TMEM175 family protein [Flavobacterium sp. SUN052]MEC4005154.1 TMEM175 family protein [Flavobacterium sp. SUN052]